MEGDTAYWPFACFRIPGAGIMDAATAFWMVHVRVAVPPGWIGLGAAAKVTVGVIGAAGGGGDFGVCTCTVTSAEPVAPLLPRATRL